jgi:hypothetical protein
MTETLGDGYKVAKVTHDVTLLGHRSPVRSDTGHLFNPSRCVLEWSQGDLRIWVNGARTAAGEGGCRTLQWGTYLDRGEAIPGYWPAWLYELACFALRKGAQL